RSWKLPATIGKETRKALHCARSRSWLARRQICELASFCCGYHCSRVRATPTWLTLQRPAVAPGAIRSWHDRTNFRCMRPTTVDPAAAPVLTGRWQSTAHREPAHESPDAALETDP